MRDDVVGFLGKMAPEQRPIVVREDEKDAGFARGTHVFARRQFTVFDGEVNAGILESRFD